MGLKLFHVSKRGSRSQAVKPNALWQIYTKHIKHRLAQIDPDWLWHKWPGTELCLQRGGSLKPIYTVILKKELFMIQQKA